VKHTKKQSKLAAITFQEVIYCLYFITKKKSQTKMKMLCYTYNIIYTIILASNQYIKYYRRS